jgi:hypothetical protein
MTTYRHPHGPFLEDDFYGKCSHDLTQWETNSLLPEAQQIHRAQEEVIGEQKNPPTRTRSHALIAIKSENYPMIKDHFASTQDTESLHRA